MEDLGDGLKPREICELAMDMIDGAPMVRHCWTTKRLATFVAADATKPQPVSEGWYAKFMVRNQEFIKSKKPKAYAIHRKEWGTEHNVQIFHDLFNDRLVEANLAEKLPGPVWRDKWDNSEEEAWGRKTQYKLVHHWAIRPTVWVRRYRRCCCCGMTTKRPNAPSTVSAVASTAEPARQWRFEFPAAATVPGGVP